MRRRHPLSRSAPPAPSDTTARPVRRTPRSPHSSHRPGRAACHSSAHPVSTIASSVETPAFARAPTARARAARSAMPLERPTRDLRCPLLRVYEGCGRQLAGSVEGVTLVKLARHRPPSAGVVLGVPRVRPRRASGACGGVRGRPVEAKPASSGLPAVRESADSSPERTVRQRRPPVSCAVRAPHRTGGDAGTVESRASDRDAAPMASRTL